MSRTTLRLTSLIEDIFEAEDTLPSEIEPSDLKHNFFIAEVNTAWLFKMLECSARVGEDLGCHQQHLRYICFLSIL